MTYVTLGGVCIALWVVYGEVVAYGRRQAIGTQAVSSPIDKLTSEPKNKPSRKSNKQ